MIKLNTLLDKLDDAVEGGFSPDSLWDEIYNEIERIQDSLERIVELGEMYLAIKPDFIRPESVILDMISVAQEELKNETN